jgi:hypothetical protein
MRFQQGEENAYNDKRRLLLGLIILIVLIMVGIVIYYLVDFGYIAVPDFKDEEPDNVGANNTSVNKTHPKGKEGDELEFSIMLVDGYNDLTLAPYVREGSDYYWDDDVILYVNVSDFGFFRGKDYKFVMLNGALEVIGPTGEKILPFSDEDAIEFDQSLPLKSEMIPFILTIETNYPQLRQYGLVGRYKATLTITDNVLEETESKTIYFNLNKG